MIWISIVNFQNKLQVAPVIGNVNTKHLLKFVV